MNFSPKREEDLPKFGPFPNGDYDGTVAEASDCISQTSGADQIHLVVRFKNDEGRTRTVHDYLNPAMEGKLRHFCVHAGLEEQYDTGSLCAADCQGIDVRAKLRIRKQDGYEDKNEVADYLPRQTAGPRQEAARPNTAPAGAFPDSRESAKKGFLVSWNAFASEFPSEAGKRDSYWTKAVKEYFEGREQSSLTMADWSKMAVAFRLKQWNPAQGWKIPQTAAANGSPISDTPQFKEDDIPF